MPQAITLGTDLASSDDLPLKFVHTVRNASISQRGHKEVALPSSPYETCLSLLIAGWCAVKVAEICLGGKSYRPSIVDTCMTERR